MLAALLLSWTQPAAQVQVSQPYVGVTYIDRWVEAPRRIHMHIAQIDLAAPGLRFKVSSPAGNREVVRQSTLAFLQQENAQLAINGHFFLPFPSTDREAWVIGLAASEGRVYSAFESPEQNYALVADAPAINIDRENRATIVHRDPSQPGGRHVLERVTLWNVIAGSSQIVTNGVASVPAYRDAANPGALLMPGGPGGYSNAKAWSEVATARTAIGLSRDRRTLTLFTADVRGGSEGMRLGEVADVLIRDYGAWDALNLDGGGSTSMAMRDPASGQAALVNTSSDNPAGREVATSLAVFASPVPR
ncbi:MAG: phosphodiester glycosidase family protein [Vicinamibacterales bacterium]